MPVRTHLKLKDIFFAVVLAGAFAGCSGDPSQDSGPALDIFYNDFALLPDGYGPLKECSTVGLLCDADDPCAIDPICGIDHLCHPLGLLDCNDNLDCTEDKCLGIGQCGHTPKQGLCVLEVKVTSSTQSDAGTDSGITHMVLACFETGERNPDDPCQGCDPTQSIWEWSVATGQPCDDGNACTKDDYCQKGICKGTNFLDQCADEYDCTQDLCDGVGGCLGNPLRSDWCMFDGECVMEQQKDLTGCYICDPNQSQTSWTKLTNTCLINAKCYLAGDKDQTGCEVCDPTQNEHGWTPISNQCKISGTCYAKGDIHPQGCAECDPSLNYTSWSVYPNNCLIDNICYLPFTIDQSNCNHCDPLLSQTQWSAMTDLCVVDGFCKTPGTVHAQGCAKCDTSISMTSWIIDSDKCLIDDVCYNSGATDSTGCGVCTPSISKTSWTVNSGSCLIDNVCYASGAVHPAGCAECDPLVSNTSWTVKGDYCLINDTCYSPETINDVGCGKCDSASSKTSWTQIPSCFKIIFTTLNEAHDGKMGRHFGADLKCQTQAEKAGYSGTFKAFVSDSTQDVKNIITGTNASSVPVVNTKGQVLYNNWNQIFTSIKWANNNYKIYSFNGTLVDEGTVTPNWENAHAWHGSLPGGTWRKGFNCIDWTNGGGAIGSFGELDPPDVEWVGTATTICQKLFAVVCIQVAP